MICSVLNQYSQQSREYWNLETPDAVAPTAGRPQKAILGKRCCMDIEMWFWSWEEKLNQGCEFMSCLFIELLESKGDKIWKGLKHSFPLRGSTHLRARFVAVFCLCLSMGFGAAPLTGRAEVSLASVPELLSQSLNLEQFPFPVETIHQQIWMLQIKYHQKFTSWWTIPRWTKHPYVQPRVEMTWFLPPGDPTA